MPELAECVKRKMSKIVEEESHLPEGKRKTQKQRLGKAFGICRQKTDFSIIHDFVSDVLKTDQSPFSLVDEETGIGIPGRVGVPGEVNIPLIPVSSTDVKGIGVFGEELLAQFHANSGTYRFPVGSNKVAQEVFNQFLIAGSKGKWLWKNIRGHVKGESTKGKIGPSLIRGIPTVGGTTKSLIWPYDIAGRSPVPKLGGFQSFEAIASKLKGFKEDPAKLIGKPITIAPPSIEKKLAKIISGTKTFKSIKQLKQRERELQARTKLKQLQQGNIIKGVI